MAGRSEVSNWWFPPVPLGRIAALRLVVYGFVPLDVLWWDRWVQRRVAVPGDWYRPLAVGRLLHLPTPTSGLVSALGIGLLVAAVLALSGRAPRLLGTTVFLLYAEWMVVAMSYGKVDHDRFALLVALAVLPTVGTARRCDLRPSEAAGWAVRCVQVAVVATYFLASVAKIRFGGWGWVNGETLVWAVTRRGTFLAQPLLHVRWVLHLTQWGIVAMELASPLLLVLRGRARATMLWLLLAFHLVTFATITILFLPHVICLLAFVPLERLRRPTGRRRSAQRPQWAGALDARLGTAPQ